MAAIVNQANPPLAVITTDVPFIDKHFAKIAFAISTLVLLIFSPLYLFLGSVAGFALHNSLEPDLRVQDENQIVTLSNSVFSIVGAVAALIRLLPAGAEAGLIFRAVPLVASFAIGSTAYRAFKTC
jgi:hypothetical protein